MFDFDVITGTPQLPVRKPESAAQDATAAVDRPPRRGDPAVAEMRTAQNPPTAPRTP